MAHDDSAAEAQRILAERPESARALAVLQKALDGLGLGNTRQGLDVLERIDRLPDEERQRIYGGSR